VDELQKELRLFKTAVVQVLAPLPQKGNLRSGRGRKAWAFRERRTLRERTQ
jgi:hypothetical protein